MSLKFVKKFVPNLSNDAENHVNKTSPAYYQNYALTTTNDAHIDALIKKGGFRVKEAIASNPNIKDHHLDRLFDDEDAKIRAAAARNPNAKTSHLAKAIENSSDYLETRDMIDLPTATADVIYNIARNNHLGWYDKNDLISNVISQKRGEITSNHLDDLISNFGGNLNMSTIKKIIRHPSATADIQSNYLKQHPNSVDNDTIAAIIDSSKVSSDDLVNFYHNASNRHIRNEMIEHSTNPDFHEKLVNSFDENTTNSHIGESVSTIAKYSPETAQLKFMNNKNIMTEHKALLAYVTPHRSVHQVGLVSPDEEIRELAGMNRHFRKMNQSISESFDSPSKTTEIPEDSMLHQMGSMSASMIGGTNFKMHKLDGNGYIIQFDKDGATELHHVDDNLSGGYSTNTSVPVRMIGAFRDRAKALIDSGRRVRIVAHSTLATPFKNITKRLVSRNPEYKVSDPIYGEHEMTGDKTVSWEISK